MSYGQPSQQQKCFKNIFMFPATTSNTPSGSGIIIIYDHILDKFYGFYLLCLLVSFCS